MVDLIELLLCCIYLFIYLYLLSVFVTTGFRCALVRCPESGKGPRNLPFCVIPVWQLVMRYFFFNLVNININ